MIIYLSFGLLILLLLAGMAYLTVSLNQMEKKFESAMEKLQQHFTAALAEQAPSTKIKKEKGNP